MPDCSDTDRIGFLIDQLTALRDRALELERSFRAEIESVLPERRDSARNLLHYLAMRQCDLRDLQRSLSKLGLSSLGGMEAHALASVQAVLTALLALAGRSADGMAVAQPPVDFDVGQSLLDEHAVELLGPKPVDRPVWTTITMSTEAATDPKLIRELLMAGMDVMRINCARDDHRAWGAMIRNLHAAENELGRSCRIWMDLAGPKLRTGHIDTDPGVVKIRPKRNTHGEVVMPARVWLTPIDAAEMPPDQADAAIPIEDELVAKSHAGDVLTFNDTRDRTRMLEIVQEVGASRWATSEQTAYLQSNSVVDLCVWDGTVIAGRVGSIAGADTPIVVKVGETLILTPEGKAGQAAEYGPDGEFLRPAQVPVLLAEAFGNVRSGERIFFDDGRIGGVIREAASDRIEVEITYAREQRSKLRSDRGINLPDSQLNLPALTDKDRQDLDFVVQHADMVSLSFIRRPDDVLQLQEELAGRDASHVGIVVKIETGAAFRQLPRLLLVGLRWSPFGVVVARGDLSVEIGFDRLAEVQEEILWLCESAHVPVIWATQVLEMLAKTGQPSRAEVTDAAMSVRAECVMLNKGAHIVEALKFLTNVLRRMQAHHSKKQSMLRRLSIANLK